MKISVVILALTVTRVFCQVGMQGDVDIDDQLFTCMSSCMCSCISEGHGSIMLEGNNTSSMPESEQVTAEAVYAQPRIEKPENSEPVSEAPASEESETEAPESEEAGFSYSFPIEKTYTAVDPISFITIDEFPEPQQEIVYGETVDADNPLMVDFYVYNYDTDNFVYSIYSDNPISACDEYESGTWKDVAIRIIDTGLMPDGKCPVKAGNHTVPGIYEVPAKFDEQLECGNYRLTANIYAHDEYILQPYFEWDVSNDCV